MDPKQARQIAYHHLGERLSELRPPRDGHGWIVRTLPEFLPGATWTTLPALFVEGSTPEEAAREAASQLRAGGWVPSHARLEWDAGEDGFELLLRVDKHVSVLWSYGDGADDEPNIADRATTIQQIRAWHAANLPSLHLPPFPGASDAT